MGEPNLITDMALNLKSNVFLWTENPNLEVLLLNYTIAISFMNKYGFSVLVQAPQKTEPKAKVYVLAHVKTVGGNSARREEKGNETGKENKH